MGVQKQDFGDRIPKVDRLDTLAKPNEMPSMKRTHNSSAGLPRFDGHEAGLGEGVQHSFGADETV
jgi:hypothetical protein